MIKGIMDWASVAVAAGALMKMLPAVAAVFSIVWLSISIWESKTVRGWFKRGKVTQGDTVDSAYEGSYVEEDSSNKGDGHGK